MLLIIQYAGISYETRIHNIQTSLIYLRCAQSLHPQQSRGTHVEQGGTPSPGGSQDSVSSSGGHSAPSPTGNWSTCLFRVRLPLGKSGSTQILVQELHSAQSVSWQSLGRTQDWMVNGRSLSVHKLQRKKVQRQVRP